MAKPNYSMAKRQRDLAKKAKAEEKRLRKAQAHANPEGEAAAEGAEDAEDSGIESSAPAEEEP